MKKLNALQTHSGIVLFYPGRLLASQICDWAERHGECQTEISFERSLPDMRKLLRRAELAVIDATEDPAQASDAFLQSVGVLKADAVVVYTEKMYDGLESLVRALGAPLLLGPMRMDQWEEFLDHMFPAIIPMDSTAASMRRANREALWKITESQHDNVLYYRPKAG